MRGDGGTMRRYAPLGDWQRIDPDPPVPIGEKLEWAIHEIIFFYLGKATVLLLTVGLVRVKDDDDASALGGIQFGECPTESLRSRSRGRPLSASSSSRRRGSEWSPCCADNGSLRRSDRLPSMLLYVRRWRDTSRTRRRPRPRNRPGVEPPLMRNRIPLNQKRLCVDFVHEDEWELDGTVRILSHKQPLRAGFAERTLATSSTELTEDADHATGQASFEAEKHNQSRRRDGAGCHRTGFFAAG